MTTCEMTGYTSAAAAEYGRLRDCIEAVAALSRTAQREAEQLDTETFDVLSPAAKADVAAAIWSRLMGSVAAQDR